MTTNVPFCMASGGVGLRSQPIFQPVPAFSPASTFPVAAPPQGVKLSHRVDFRLEGLDLDALGALPAESVQKVEPIFDLFAVVDHVGSSGAGHYTAIVSHRKTGRWHRMDDAVVSGPLEPSQVPSQNAYLLFFRRRDGLVRTQTRRNPGAWPHLVKRDWSFLEEEIQEGTQDSLPHFEHG